MVAAKPPTRPRTDAAAADSADDSRLESGWIEVALGGSVPAAYRPPKGRAARLLLLGLLAAAVLVLWMRLLASGPHLPLDWQLHDDGMATVAPNRQPALAPWTGHAVEELVSPQGQRLALPQLGDQQAQRWIVQDAQRARQQQRQAQIAQVLAQPQLTWVFSPAGTALADVPSRGLSGLGLASWLLCALTGALLLAAAVVLLTNPGLPAGLFVLMALAQSLNLLLLAGELLPGLGTPAWMVSYALLLGRWADVVMAAALVHLAAHYPRRIAVARPWAAGIWGLAALLLAALGQQLLPGAWWWAQAWTLLCGALAVGLLLRSERADGGPLARLLRYLVLAALSTHVLIGLANAWSTQDSPQPYAIALAGLVVWHVFVASLLLLGPFLSRSRRVMRELALLAGVSTVAAALDLLLETGTALDNVVSLLLALGVSTGLYLLAKRWVLSQLTGSAGISGERLFDSLYRMARALEPAPDQAGPQLTALLREVFNPLQIAQATQTVTRVKLLQDGSTLVVPIPAMAEGPDARHLAGSIVLRHAHHGQRLFSPDDQNLVERLIEQLSRAVAYDRAVERGRTEERTRIAQDLHDDIGARLLTLMYKAPNAEIEEYIRHTLQDLKTLTRGLAASNHRLSHAAAEWKADLSQRLNATGCDLHWSFSADRDIILNVVQWSGLTRIMRELVNNIISHAQATQVEVSVQVDRGRLALVICDDGIGRAPAHWSHGLGLGGVRKRAKLLGGQVQWLEAQPRGIRCEVRAPLTADRPS